MKGKKINKDFINSYLDFWSKNGLSSLEEICKKAKLEIDEIDIKIIEAEKLKKKRSNLIDVISYFKKINHLT